jgi:hypothetical protein
MEAGGNVRGS